MLKNETPEVMNTSLTTNVLKGLPEKCFCGSVSDRTNAIQIQAALNR